MCGGAAGVGQAPRCKRLRRAAECPLPRRGRGRGPNEVGGGEGKRAPNVDGGLLPLISPLRSATGPFFSR